MSWSKFTESALMERAIALSVDCPDCEAEANTPCVAYGTSHYAVFVCGICKAKGPYLLHEMRYALGATKCAIWQLACQAKNGPTDEMLAGYMGEDHASFCPYSD